MSNDCPHVSSVVTVTPLSRGCGECLAAGTRWFHLRLCRVCGHVGCCDQSPGRHASGHFRATHHAVIEGYDPPEGWGWCFVDNMMVELPDQTPQLGPIPRYY